MPKSAFYAFPNVKLDRLEGRTARQCAARRAGVALISKAHAPKRGELPDKADRASIAYATSGLANSATSFTKPHLCLAWSGLSEHLLEMRPDSLLAYAEDRCNVGNTTDLDNAKQDAQLSRR